MFIAKTLSFYKLPEVRRALVEQARDKEVSVRFQTFFGKRPDALFNEGDVLELAKKKASSFHCSEELWSNPLLIQTGMGRKDVEELRTGWDLILDVDCPYWPLSKLITHLFIKALEAHGIAAVTAKFSGNKGFHVAVPFQSFPEMFQGQKTKDLFPEAPRRIAYYLLDYLVEHYLEERDDHLLFDGQYRISKERLAKRLGKRVEDLTTAQEEERKVHLLCPSCGLIAKTDQEGGTNLCPSCGAIMQEHVTRQRRREGPARFDPLTIIEVDTILLAHRHLYRMPYSFHEKSELVSVPVDKDRVLSFKKSQAEPDAVDFSIPFLDRSAAVPEEATKLLIAAYDSDPKLEEDVAEKKEYAIPEEAIPEEYFPPCIHAMLSGLKDGRKRALFTLINFLRGAGWSFEQIEDRLDEWNQQNEEPLRQVIIKGRLRYERAKKDAAPPHNCKRYYQDFGVCRPDEFCDRIKNPLQYARLKYEHSQGRGKGGRAKLTDEQKAMRRAYRERQKAREDHS
ncbi:hypothetical protein JXA12_02735 [Candidatus Woesearchaeota archaeon]|nr:hypothetical protein [Candidatus Woesearchaeota archaeon]